jgi:myo-inositol-1(or 4)-monophosphatase
MTAEASSGHTGDFDASGLDVRSELDARSWLDARFAVGRALIEEAGALALHHFGRLDSLAVTGKGRQDMASEADLAVELLIRDRLAAAFPSDGFLGEETGRGEADATDRLWVVDPIDGTQPFLLGMSSWCVSIALVAHDRIELGFVAAPARDELFVGRRDAGATLNERPIEVSRATRLDQGMVAVGYSPRVGADDTVPMFERLLRQGAMFYRDGSGALALCYVACGRLIGYLEAHINSWDCLAALAILESAGGQASDVLEGDRLWSGGHLIAGPPALMPALEAVYHGGRAGGR